MYPSQQEKALTLQILKLRMQPLIQAGIIIVTSSGPSQEGLKDSIDSFPAKLALDIPIISVGFINPGGVPIGPPESASLLQSIINAAGAFYGPNIIRGLTLPLPSLRDL